MLLTRPACKGCCVEQEVRDVEGTGQGGKKHTAEEARERKSEAVMEASECREYVLDQKEDFRSLRVTRGCRTRVNNR